MIPFFTSNQGKALESRVETLEQGGGGGTEVSASTQLVPGAVTANSLKIGTTDYNLPQPPQVLPNYLNEKYEKVVGTVSNSGSGEVPTLNIEFTVSQFLSQRHTYVVRNKTKNDVVYGEPASWGEADMSDAGLHFVIKLIGHQKNIGATCYYDEEEDPNNYVEFQDVTNDGGNDKKYQLTLGGEFGLLADGSTWEDEDEIEVECITSPVPFYIGSLYN